MDSTLRTLKVKYDDAMFPFKGKDKTVVLKNGSFDRKMLIDTVFALNTVCIALLDA